MRAGERPGRGNGGKLLALLRLLEQEAYPQFRYPGQGHRFSLVLFDQIAASWGGWQNGIPPGRSFAGRGAQNPWLLRAFSVLTAARGRAEMDATKGAGPESRAGFEARILAQQEGR